MTPIPPWQVIGILSEYDMSGWLWRLWMRPDPRHPANAGRLGTPVVGVPGRGLMLVDDTDTLSPHGEGDVVVRDADGRPTVAMEWAVLIQPFDSADPWVGCRADADALLARFGARTIGYRPESGWYVFDAPPMSERSR